MSRHKVTTLVAEHALARTLALALEEFVTPPAHATALFEEGAEFRLDAYYDERPEPKALAAQLTPIVAPAVCPPLSVLDVPAENWVRVSQAALPPVVAGRFTVFGSHDRGRVPRGPNAILIDAGEAFGTAHHATTQGCLMAIGALAPVAHGVRLLDLGCGSGVLAIALTRRFPSAHITASDIDPLAIEVARDNARLNGAGRRIRFVTAAGLGTGLLAGPFDAIVANILAGPLIALAPKLRRALHTGGSLVLSGILTSQAGDVVARYRALAFSLLAHRRIAGWSTLTLRRN